MRTIDSIPHQIDAPAEHPAHTGNVVRSVGQWFRKGYTYVATGVPPALQGTLTTQDVDRIYTQFIEQLADFCRVAQEQRNDKHKAVKASLFSMNLTPEMKIGALMHVLGKFRLDGNDDVVTFFKRRFTIPEEEQIDNKKQ